MKEILAVIRMNKINQTKQALVEAGFPSFTAVKVAGRGRQALEAEIIAPLNEHPEDVTEVLPLLARIPYLIPKRLISLIVPNELVKPVVDILIKVNQTNNPGDGKIFVLPILESLRIRTGETGRLAINEMGG